MLGVSRQDLLSTKRTAAVSHARQLAMYLSRELTSLSLAQIARQFDRDHTTILHAIRAVSSTRLEPTPRQLTLSTEPVNSSVRTRAGHRCRLLTVPSTVHHNRRPPTETPQVKP